jgi:hypothetical protein
MQTYYHHLSSKSIFGDKRLTQRFGLVLDSLHMQIHTSISRCQATNKEQAGFYRFMNNTKVTHNRIVLTSHECTRDWALTSDSKVILSINDTTEANYTGQPVAPEIGCLSQAYQKGYFIHSQLLMSENALCQGVYYQDIWDRDPATIGAARSDTKRDKRPFEERESYRWVAGFERLNADFAHVTDKTFVHIGDRETDLFELMSAPRAPHIHYLFRAKFDRKINESEKLFASIGVLPLRGIINAKIPIKDKHHIKRDAILEIRYTPVTFSANGYTTQKQEGKLATANFIEIKEINAPDDVEPIHWRLLTSLPIDTFELALNTLKYYLLRWRIEEFHVILKQGCAIEELSFDEPNAIRNLIITYSIVAAKILNFRYIYDELPNESIEITGFSVQNYNTIAQYLAHKTKSDFEKKTMPTAAEFIMLIQRLGSGNKYPKKVGVRALWQGLQIAQTILEAFDAFVKTG